MRFGLGMNRDHTLKQVGQQFSVTRERIRTPETCPSLCSGSHQTVRRPPSNHNLSLELCTARAVRQFGNSVKSSLRASFPARLAASTVS